MIKKLAVENVNPFSRQSFEFAKRLNVFTGDNGLGKSFLLDIVWYALTRRWPHEINPAFIDGYVALPFSPDKKARMVFDITTEKGRKLSDYKVTFNPEIQKWIGRVGRPYSAGLVVYAKANGGFAVWDPARNYWRTRGGEDVADYDDGYVFTEYEVINGQNKFRTGRETAQTRSVIRGLVEDLHLWQTADSVEYKMFCCLLEDISPMDMPLRLGAAKRVFVDDFRDYPIIETKFGSVPVIFASSAILRVLSLVYIVTWAISENRKASQIMGWAPARQVTFLFDEVEAHLHPKWQRTIIPSIIGAIGRIMTEHVGESSSGGSTQIMVTTHSPLVMSSLENVFYQGSDAWFDLDATGDGLMVTRHDEYDKNGSADNWLLSDAFDLDSTYSVETQRLLDDATDLLRDEIRLRKTIETTYDDAVKKAYKELLRVLDPRDPFLARFRAICEKKEIVYK